jgi:tight adherence protein C
MNPFDLMLGMIGPDGAPIAISGLIFIAVAGLTVAIATSLSAGREVRHRIQKSGTLASAQPTSPHGGGEAARQVIDRATRYFLPSDQRNVRKLQQDLVRAGYLDPASIGRFFMARVLLAAILGVVAVFVVPSMFPERPASFHWLLIGAGATLGYYLPTIHVGRRIKARVEEHRDGFPDFLDLLVVCADAGLSMEAAIDRVSREMAASYPSLSTHLSIASLEMRAGAALTDALEHLSDRLGLDEARAFTTLIQQSVEFGSSLTDSLRIYSEDMRHRRLSRAEEKANSLPSKLSLPLMLFIFPIIIVVIVLPVVVRVQDAGF